MPKQLSPEQLARKKKLQAGLSVTGGTLGLAALGAKGGSYVLRRAGKVARSAKVDRATTGLLATGAGIGGLGSFNFAATERAEASGVKPKPVSTIKKNDIFAPNEAAAAKIRAVKPNANIIIGKPPKKKSNETRAQRVSRQNAQRKQSAKSIILSNKSSKKPSLLFRLSEKKVPGGKIGAGAALIGAGAGSGYAAGKLSKRDNGAKSAAIGAGATYGTYISGGYALNNATKFASMKDKKSNEAMGKHRKSMGLPKGSLSRKASKKQIEAFYRTTPKEVKFSGTKRILARTHGVSGYGRMAVPVVTAGAAGGYMYSRGKVSKASQAQLDQRFRDKVTAGGVVASGAGIYAALDTSRPGVKQAMRGAAKTNYSMNRQIGNNPVVSAYKTVKSQVRANPGKMPSFKVSESFADKVLRSTQAPGFEEKIARRKIAAKTSLARTKGFAAKYYAKKPLIYGGTVAIAASPFLKKPSKSKKVSKAFDPEKRRMRRADMYTGAAIAGSAGLGAKTISDMRSNKAFRGHVRQAKTNVRNAKSFVGYYKDYMKQSRGYKLKSAASSNKSAATAAANRAKNAKTAAKANLAEGKKFSRMAGKHVYSAGKIVATHKPLLAAVALAGAAPAIQRQKKNSGRVYTTWYDGKKAPKRRFSRVDNTVPGSN